MEWDFLQSIVALILLFAIYFCNYYYHEFINVIISIFKSECNFKSNQIQILSSVTRLFPTRCLLLHHFLFTCSRGPKFPAVFCRHCKQKETEAIFQCFHLRSTKNIKMPPRDYEADKGKIVISWSLVCCCIVFFDLTFLVVLSPFPLICWFVKIYEGPPSDILWGRDTFVVRLWILHIPLLEMSVNFCLKCKIPMQFFDKSRKFVHTPSNHLDSPRIISLMRST